MIVCLCHRISDRDIHAAVGSGTDCFDVLQDDTRVASSCGCCLECAREVFDEARTRQRPAAHRTIAVAVAVAVQAG